jgi:integrase
VRRIALDSTPFYGTTSRPVARLEYTRTEWSQRERKRVRPKYDSTRTVFLPPAAKDALEECARVRDEVFSAPRGGHLSGTVMGHYWPPVARSVGRPDLTPHGLRHYYGTLLARMGLAPPLPAHRGIPCIVGRRGQLSVAEHSTF